MYECFNDVKETEKSNEVLQKNVTVLQNELIRKDEIIKSLLETQISILETVSEPSVEEEKEEEEVSPTRNEIIEEIQWQKQSSGKKNKNKPKNIYIGNLSLDTKIDDFHELFSLRSTKYLRKTCKINIPMNESKGRCKGFAFALVPEHVQKEILKLNGITLENIIIVIEDATSIRKRDAKNVQKTSKPPLAVTNKHPENQNVFSSSKLLAGMKNYVRTIRSKEKKKS